MFVRTVHMFEIVFTIGSIKVFKILFSKLKNDWLVYSKVQINFISLLLETSTKEERGFENGFVYYLHYTIVKRTRTFSH